VLSVIRNFLRIIILLTTASSSRPAALSPFVFVMIDSQTEARYGDFPFSRQLIATAIDNIAKAQADGIILKFFYDLPSNDESADRALESNICAARVALQATLEPNEGSTNALAKKFQFPARPPALIPSSFVGDKAFLPLPRFSRCAAAVGFVDCTPTEIPLLKVYQTHTVKSLFLVALEMATHEKSTLDPAGSLHLAGKRLDLTHKINFPATNSLDYIPFHEILNPTSKTWQANVAKSIVTIGYDGTKIHSIETPAGPLSAHRFFITALGSLAQSFTNR
jgi:hypothetical protein